MSEIVILHPNDANINDTFFPIPIPPPVINTFSFLSDFLVSSPLHYKNVYSAFKTKNIKKKIF